MDWKLSVTTFVAVFLAELGDKTQLATFGLAARSGAKLPVFLGAAAALIATSAIAVLFGQAIARAVPEVWLRRGAGVLFVVLGVLWLLSSTGDTATAH